jgi:hypothetical protein
MADIDEHAIVEFTTGACGYLAVVLHDLTGWQLWAEYEKEPHDGGIAHIWVLNDESRAVDINGVHEGHWAKTKYSDPKPGRIAMIDRASALERLDAEYSDWAAEIVAENPEHFFSLPVPNLSL